MLNQNIYEPLEDEGSYCSDTILNLTKLYEDTDLAYSMGVVVPHIPLSQTPTYARMTSNDGFRFHTFFVAPERVLYPHGLESDTLYYAPAFVRASWSERFSSIFSTDYMSEKISGNVAAMLGGALKNLDYIRDLWAFDEIFKNNLEVWYEIMDHLSGKVETFVKKDITIVETYGKDYLWDEFIDILVCIASIERTGLYESFPANLKCRLNCLNDAKMIAVKDAYINHFIVVQKLTNDECFNLKILVREANRFMHAISVPYALRLTPRDVEVFGFDLKPKPSQYVWSLV